MSPLTMALIVCNLVSAGTYSTPINFTSIISATFTASTISTLSNTTPTTTTTTKTTLLPESLIYILTMVYTLVGHTNMVKILAPVPNGYLASGSDDNIVRIWSN